MIEPNIEDKKGSCDQCAKILIVDDQELNIMAIELILKKMNLKSHSVKKNIEI